MDSSATSLILKALYLIYKRLTYSLLGATFRNVGDWLKSMFKTLNENSYTYSDYNYDFCKAC